MPLKKDLRKEFRKKRSELLNKSEKDNSICNNILNSDFYKNARQILCYYPLDDEIDTTSIIFDALSCGKKLSLPYCIDLNGNMEFYYIDSYDDLKCGSYGIMEPDIKKCRKVTDFSNSLCLVPAFTFDKKGYRLGYGKGYYDKFLKKFTFNSIGLCYNSFLSSKLPADEFDMAVKFIATEDKILAI